jgi:hypothetical protein
LNLKAARFLVTPVTLVFNVIDSSSFPNLMNLAWDYEAEKTSITQPLMAADPVHDPATTLTGAGAGVGVGFGACP